MFYCKVFLVILRIKNNSQVWQGISSLYTVFYQRIVPNDYFKVNLHGVSYYLFTKLPVHMPASTIFNFPQASKENAT